FSPERQTVQPSAGELAERKMADDGTRHGRQSDHPKSEPQCADHTHRRGIDGCGRGLSAITRRALKFWVMVEETSKLLERRIIILISLSGNLHFALVRTIMVN